MVTKEIIAPKEQETQEHKCELCGHTGSDVHEEQGMVYRYCCEDYAACEKRRQGILEEIYRLQFDLTPPLPEISA